MIMLSATIGNGMGEDLIGVIITAIVSGIISIIGFVLTNKSMKKNFRNELAIQRDRIAQEKMARIPYDILEYYEFIIKMGKSTNNKRVEAEFIEKTNYLYNTIYAYGSETAIKIVSKMQSTNYIMVNSAEDKNKYKLLAYLILLSTQVKKDVTAIEVNPKYWLQMRLTDYSTNHKEIDNAINIVIEELSLSKQYRIV